jgi:hypothetical protein
MEWRGNSQRAGEWKGKGRKMVLGRGIKWNGMAGKIVKGFGSGKERAGRWLMGDGGGENHLGTDLHLPNYSQPAGGGGGIQGERTDGFQQRVRGNP